MYDSLLIHVFILSLKIILIESHRRCGKSRCHWNGGRCGQVAFILGADEKSASLHRRLCTRLRIRPAN
jgi:hypothetical protein